MTKKTELTLELSIGQKMTLQTALIIAENHMYQLKEKFGQDFLGTTLQIVTDLIEFVYSESAKQENTENQAI